jgi:hypothetical protein
VNDVSQAPGGGAAPQPAGSNTKATWSLICGILSLFICPIILSIVAIVLGNQAKGEIQRTGESGEGLATAGQVLGVIGIIVGVVTFIIVVL